MTASASLSFVSVISDNIVGLADFYTSVFDLEPVNELASEHFRAARIGGTVLGFSAPSAFSMLGLDPVQQPQPPTTFWTFEVDTPEAVDTLTQKAIDTGARCVKEPARTYYGSWQSVLLDPQGNAFRVNHTGA